VDKLVRRNWHVTMMLLVFCFSVSFVTLIVYMTDTYFPDETLFILLAVLRYSSFMVCVCSIYKLIVSIYRILRRPSAVGVVKVFIYFAFLVYGAAIVFFEAFVNVISRGNG